MGLMTYTVEGDPYGQHSSQYVRRPVGYPEIFWQGEGEENN